MNLDIFKQANVYIIEYFWIPYVHFQYIYVYKFVIYKTSRIKTTLIQKKNIGACKSTKI